MKYGEVVYINSYTLVFAKNSFFSHRNQNLNVNKNENKYLVASPQGAMAYHWIFFSLEVVGRVATHNFK